MQGTPPFIALELLIHGSSHRVAHDLESVLYVLLFICTHLNGPFGEIRDPPLYGSNTTHPSGMKEWFNSKYDLYVLGHVKYSQMMAHFESHILNHISPYFHPLMNYITGIWDALIRPDVRGQTDGKKAVHSFATPHNIIEVFKVALLDDRLIEDAKVAHKHSNTHSLPGELVVGSNCWDTVKPSKTSKKPRLNSITT